MIAMNIIGDYKDKIRSDIKTFLTMFKYTTESRDDTRILEFLFNKHLQSFKNLLNRDDVPMELYYPLLHRVVGDFLNTKLATNSLNVEGLDFGPIASTLTRGKVTMKLEGLSPKEAFEKVVRGLLNDGQDEMYNFRCIRW